MKQIDIIVLTSLSVCLIVAAYLLGTQRPNRIHTSLHRQVSSHLLPLSLPNHTDVVWVEMLSDNPRIMLFHHFLEAKECLDLINLADSRMVPSTVQADGLQQSRDRTSYSTNLEKKENELVTSVEKRCVMFSGYPYSNLEPLQVVRYHPGQFYKPHMDYFIPGKRGTTEALKRGGQRTITFFIYLNNLASDETGGATVFPQLRLKIKPRAGTALFFNNLLPDGKEDNRMLHGGEPPKQSVKYGMNAWFRQAPFH